jgi:5'-nucleotidase / UDP-sugar diphosphatase
VTFFVFRFSFTTGNEKRETRNEKRETATLQIVRPLLVTALLLAAIPAHATTVTLLHFSDYHSHALPFYSEGREEQGGIANALHDLRRHKRRGALVFSGGDMMNKGAPAWSDRYRCAEWPWFNGIVDAMAFGNHDADYGYADFVRCRDLVRYPILSANTEGFRPYVVLKARGLRIGVFAVAGSDFPQLVKVPELRFTDPVAAARETVRRLREVERADAVVLIGHQHAESDFALARAVPGIDLIFGSHSHLKQELTRIDGTSTWFISPYQYLTYFSEVEMTFQKRELVSVRGRLVRVDAKRRPDRPTLRKVSAMDRDLRNDPRYRDLFIPFTALDSPMSVDALGRYAVDLMREVTKSDVAISTASSFRQPLPPGAIDGEILRAALPYDNEIVVAELTPEKLGRLIALSGGADPSFVSGEPGSAALVRVATTDYLARVAAGYREVFEGVEIRPTGLRVREEIRRKLQSHRSMRSTP